MMKLVIALPVRSLEDIKLVPTLNSDLVELRLDYLKKPEDFDLSLIEDIKDRVIVTVRDPSEGGVKEVDEDWKASLYKKLHDMGVLYDVEARFLRKRKDIPFEGKIVSAHFFDRVPSIKEVEEIFKGLEGAWIKKLAVTAREGYKELLAHFARKGFAVMLMVLDPIERIAFAILGSELIYASLDKGLETAPGQMSYKKVKEILSCLGLR
ncbi:type I 3-dehydroquinate dehydratase [Candidatus Nanobsidianus stetteri]|uniref:3-dehydroquinate dehydratase n=1 Tax=Nanobsidianus stetteri TaxID=1294122 RepID=A0A2T9WV60_NANST|nr:type I 3-dehydroquinate dehydratase [Candidatus Nanobsidianus stetteri]